MYDELITLKSSQVTESAEMMKFLLALNNAHALGLSLLNGESLQQLLEHPFFACRIGQVEAFMIALDQGATYRSPNFIWFLSRFERFVYVDRIVVSPQARGRGYARHLYQKLFERARAAGHDVIACEVNSVPPNPESAAFHRALGFVEVGTGPVAGSTKMVRYLIKRLVPGTLTTPEGARE